MTVVPANLTNEVQTRSIPRFATWPITIGLITLVAAVLRIAGIGRHSFWYDEAVTARIIRSPWIDLLLGRARDNGNPPLYWLAAKFWATLFGDSEVALRSLSVIVSLAAIPIFALLAAKLLDRGTALLAVALLAISPLTLELADEARCYALLQLLAIASTWLLVAWTDSRKNSTLIAYSVTVLLASLCHYYAIFLPLSHLVFLLSSRRELLTRWIFAMCATALAGSFWATAFLAQMNAGDNLSRMGSRWSLQFFATPLALMVGRTLVWRDAGTLLLGGATCAVGIFFWLPALFAIRRSTILLIAWLVLPIALPLIAALLGVPMYHVRAASIALPAAILLAGRGLANLPKTPRAVACVGIAALTAISIANYMRQALKDDWRSATPAIASHLAPSSALVFDTSIEAVSFDYYARRIGTIKPAITIGIVEPATLSGVQYDGNKQLEQQPRDYELQLAESSDVTLVLCVPNGSFSKYREFFSRHEMTLADESHFHRIDVYHFKHVRH